ncbi:MAG: acetyl-CoA carboxylase biotin carboxyl carrier protein [Crocinitomicaceae bacterium]|jgi:acetyl-CoA carboxylase biotin carboxyl carrier protein|nr:acetyl-CoA carboxylase biotin carboxyl carrier protein [Crocinitomicaceae bacterium]MDP4722757.1 acetyl-CoA carboxylase biotin carboxyl carrier protein [Crocinitomicaceae bacterium]MDP4739551.1 acetyl-CoA carboxylase biotin carboxyl carrier protein [Crocinitomicaceae bacterium]MDP4798703.1 acetyl-CoA carboxylase biotin carboxyl carrier protein [Crocinitomicaceae bacterium]MDP4807518.1 acetyl-CoA carboxylase biotin carboxyl carrier protein [Crocinitomicaceae bacterium]
MNLEEIKDLIKLVSKSGLGKVEIEREGFRISIKGSQSEPIMYQAAPMVAAPVAAAPAPVAASAAPASTETNNSDDSKYITVKSPMIGTFYRTPGPDKDAFVNVGDIIQSGDKVCIIEAMKTFNEIEAEISGKIVKVLVDNASPVDYDQPLFLVDPA